MIQEMLWEEINYCDEHLLLFVGETLNLEVWENLTILGQYEAQSN